MRRRACLAPLVLPALLGAAAAGPHPIALIDFRADGLGIAPLLGGWDGGRWVTATALQSRLRAGTAWQVQTLSGQARRATSPAPERDGPPCEDSVLVLLPATPSPGEYALATSPALNTRPRPVQALPLQNATYREVVRQELVRRGLSRPNVQLTQLVRADLDGNGTQEVLIGARAYAQATSSGEVSPHAGRGDYSLLLLRWVAPGGAVRTTVLGAEVFLRDERQDEWQMPTLTELAGVADLNADGRMELVTVSRYYEGQSASVGEWTPAGGLRERLSVGCGV